MKIKFNVMINGYIVGYVMATGLTDANVQVKRLYPDNPDAYAAPVNYTW